MSDDGQPVGDLVVGWRPRAFPSPVTLEGRYVRVEPLTARHADPLFGATCGPLDDDLWTYRREPKPASRAAMAAVIDGLIATEGLSTSTYVLVPVEDEPFETPAARAPHEPSSDLAAGVASYQRLDLANGTIEIGGVLLGKRLQRTRAATEALHLLMRHALETLGFRRLEWKLDCLNAPSYRAAQRLGFRYEGRFRNHMVVKGRSRDTDWFAATDADWPSLRAAHERWLDPGNFDADGYQRTSLSELTARLDELD